MEINCKEIRRAARRSLYGNWRVAAQSVLVYSIFSLVHIFVPEFAEKHAWLLLAIAIIYGSFFAFGYTKIMLYISRGKDIGTRDMFMERKRFGKALVMTLLVWLYTFAWGLLFIIPGIIAIYKYSMTFFVWLDNPDIRINEAMDRSDRMTKGHKWDVFKLSLSFIGWRILALTPVLALLTWYVVKDDFFFFEPATFWALYKPCILIYFFGSVFINAYSNIAKVKLYDKLLEENRMK